MEEAYREYVTTSPSYHLLASADAAVRTLAPAATTSSAARSSARASSRPRCTIACPTSTAWTTPRGSQATATASAARTSSRHLGLSRYGLSGYDVAQALVERGIVIEKAGVHTITLITTFQLARRGARHRSTRWHDILSATACRAARASRCRTNPFRRHRRPAGDPPLPRAPYAKSIGHEVPLREADRQGRRRGGRGLPARASR
jgi:lysine decarboxylase